MKPLGLIPGLKYVVYGILILIIGLVLIYFSYHFNMILFKTLGILTIIVCVFPFVIGLYIYLQFKMFGPTYDQKVSNEVFVDIVMRCMLSMALIHRIPSNLDTYKIRRIYKLIFNYEPAEYIIYNISENIYSNGFKLHNYLPNMNRHIERSLKINLFKAFYLVCDKRAEMTFEEKKMLSQIANLLSVSNRQAQSAMDEVDKANYILI